MADFNYEEGPRKIFLDKFQAQVRNGLLHLMLKSGKEEYVYVLQLDLAKKLGKGLSSQIKAVEVQLGVSIDDKLDDEPTLSPLSSEFEKPEDGK